MPNPRHPTRTGIQADRAAAKPSIDHWRTGAAPSDHKPAAATASPAGAKAENGAPEQDVADAQGTVESERTPPPADTDGVFGETTDGYTPSADPLADQDPAKPFSDDADAVFDGDDFDAEGSRFDYSPPFTRRRNSAKMWTIAAAVFAALAAGAIFAVNTYSLPSWFPIARPVFGAQPANLALDFQASEQRPETLESGEEIFRVRGTITNTGAETTPVPSLLIVFRDERERQVGNWVVVPAKRELAPGESLNVTEAIADIPPTAQAAYIGWSPG